MTEFEHVFVDTAPYIYGLEHNDKYYEQVKSFFTGCVNGRKRMFTSVITIEEYCIIPYRNKKQSLVDNFKRFLEDTGTQVVDINTAIADKAARIRAEYVGIKSMDALQLATAIISQCDLFLTNDRQLQQVSEIKVKLVSEL